MFLASPSGGLAGAGLALAVVALLAPGSVGAASTPTPSASSSNAVWLAVYNGLEVQALVHQFGGELRVGDGIAVVFDANATAWSQDNLYGAELHQAFPNVTLRAYVSLDGGTGHAGGLATTLRLISPIFTQVSADWEPNGPVEFNPSFAATTAYFHQFASLVQASGRAAIGYPSGRGVFGSYAGAPDNWNYGAFATQLNGMTIETQGFCAGNGTWAPAVGKIWSQYNASHLATSTLSLQISLGTGGNGASTHQAIVCANYWRHVDHGNLFFWWGIAQTASLQGVLKALGR